MDYEEDGEPIAVSVRLDVEVRAKQDCSVPLSMIGSAVTSYLGLSKRDLRPGLMLEGWQKEQKTGPLSEVEKIRLGESSESHEGRRGCSCAHHNSKIAPRRRRISNGEEVEFVVHVYQAAARDDIDELSAADPEAGDVSGSDVMAATVMELPNMELEGVWESLIYEGDIKTRLLNYIYTTLVFSDADIDFNIVSWNRLVLLHGPPGTGKTSLCRALAQKLAIRLSNKFTHGKLIEVNSHSLFSKWFSESGKLVQRLFSMVTEMVEDEDGFVVILIDEVESLTKARSSAGSGSEPSDSLRVVNALLTQLDKLKQRKNCLVMTTSNISDSIDDAFIDRADIKQYIGPPPAEAIYSVLFSCVEELMRVGLVQQLDISDAADAAERHANGSQDAITRTLWHLAESCVGISGRTLRKLPVMAHARYLDVGAKTTPDRWARAMSLALRDVKDEMRSAQQGAKTL
ncbi:AAA-domain-containing protein [Acaromyces ingoldii]|uniref:AAA-domain-containing protein n=1 Tax=Acaromyces ingoldii TaxID=215250 RepID=A0A316YUX2_9BASI|nr:AAA-domain-containing protein [Acaromyces ingoldii]PWN93079.1 AAA-domain-containing protein [Acaromyces ingoldii]